MTKVAAQTSLSPQLLAAGNGIYSTHIYEVSAAMNYAFVNSSEVLCSQETGINAALKAYSHLAVIDPTAVWTDYYRVNVWIDPDVQTVALSSTTTLDASSDLSVRFTVAGYSATHSHTSTSESTITTHPTTAASPTGVGTGWQKVVIALRRDAGTADYGAVLTRFRIEAEPIAATDIPDLVNE